MNRFGPYVKKFSSPDGWAVGGSWDLEKHIGDDTRHIGEPSRNEKAESPSGEIDYERLAGLVADKLLDKISITGGGDISVTGGHGSFTISYSGSAGSTGSTSDTNG